MDDDMEDYGFEYSDDENEEEDVDIENQYYHSKESLESGDHEDALSGFQAVVDMQQGRGEWGFKALKQVVKLRYKLGQEREMLESYREMLSYIKADVTRNDAEKKLNSLLDLVSGSDNTQLLHEFYDTTLKALKDAQNERLWFKTTLKLCALHFRTAQFVPLSKTLKELRRCCVGEDGLDDAKKGTQLLEIYAIEIQMFTAQKNNKKLKDLYRKALAVKSAIPHPRILGVVRECGGKMHMRERSFAEAAEDFFEAFKAYDEAADPTKRVRCLKYLVLANMLMESQVDPFDAQEAKPYRDDPEVAAMCDLIAAYQGGSVSQFESVLSSHRSSLTEDPFIRQYIEDLLKNVRTQVVLKLIRPYTRVRLAFVSQNLNIPTAEVEQLLVSLILDCKVVGHIDQVNGLLELKGDSRAAKQAPPTDPSAETEAASSAPDLYAETNKWVRQVGALHKAVVARCK